MKIAFVEVANFRKLLSVRIDFADATTLLVGANNSGKTSAMIALRRFLTQRKGFRSTDFTLSHWKTIDEIGKIWEETSPQVEPSDQVETWLKIYPSLDLWLDVNEGEFHYVSTLLPALDWQGGLLGIRLQFELKDLSEFRTDFLKSRNAAKGVLDGLTSGEDQITRSPKIWPESLLAFLERRMNHFQIRAYSLDPKKLKAPENGRAKIQTLDPDSVPLDGDPLERLIRINEIHAQRGFGDSADMSHETELVKRAGGRKLTEQLRKYFAKHLDPENKPTAEDLKALIAIDEAEEAFDKRLETSFLRAFAEVRGIGYPGVSDPRLKISTKLRPGVPGKFCTSVNETNWYGRSHEWHEESGILLSRS